MNVNTTYRTLLRSIIETGDKLITRNAETFSSWNLPSVEFKELPLVTVRKTAWKTALKEMEWFMSGEETCPDELLPWWESQLSPDKKYLCGYGYQFRHFVDKFDQIKYILNGLVNNPNSRRLILTTWNAFEMANITTINQNDLTPTCCHSTLVQFFVRNETLHMTSFQRSADMLLGVPHNWVQSWALLLYFAFWSDLKIGSMCWIFGDAHIYNEPSHIATLNEILGSCKQEDNKLSMLYEPTQCWNNKDIPEFKASDFSIAGTIPAPLVTTKPKLL